MINKKLFFSLMTMPVAVMCHNSSEWQGRRKEEKIREAKRRHDALNSEALDLTPKDGKFAFSGMSPEEIEEKYGFRRVKIKGILDLDNTIQIEANRNGEKGYYIVNPLYTHVNDKKEACGIMVNRGFMSKDFELMLHERMVDSDGYFEGIIYTGDKMTKYDWAPNTPASGQWTKAIPSHLALQSGLKNREDSGLAMLMLVEFDDYHKNIIPDAPSKDDLVQWKNPPERHLAYQLFWKYTTYLNLFANTMFWLYF